MRAGHKKEGKRKGEKIFRPIGNGLNGAKRKNQDLEILPLMVNPFPERGKVICTKISISDYNKRAAQQHRISRKEKWQRHLFSAGRRQKCGVTFCSHEEEGKKESCQSIFFFLSRGNDVM